MQFIHVKGKQAIYQPDLFSKTGLLDTEFNKNILSELIQVYRNLYQVYKLIPKLFENNKRSNPYCKMHGPFTWWTSYLKSLHKQVYLCSRIYVE